jgi:hypothetical protein
MRITPLRHLAISLALALAAPALGAERLPDNPGERARWNALLRADA